MSNSMPEQHRQRYAFSMKVYSGLFGDENMTEQEAKAEYESQCNSLKMGDNSPEQILDTAIALSRWYNTLGFGTTISMRAGKIRTYGFKRNTQPNVLANAYLNLTEEYIKCSR